MKKLIVILIVSFLIIGLSLNARTNVKTNSRTATKAEVRDLSGLAPHQLINSTDNHSTNNHKKITIFSDRDPNYQVYGYNAFDPTYTIPQGPATFVLNDPAGLTSLSEATLEYFLTSGTMMGDTWIGCEFNSGDLYTMDLDGTMTLLGGNGPVYNGLAYDDITGTLYGAARNITSDLYTIDPETGDGTLVGAINEGSIIAMACDNDGNLYATDYSDDMLYSIDPITGAGTIIGSLGIDLNYAQDAEYDKDDNVLYLSAYTNAGELYTCDTSTGATTFIGTFTNGIEVTAFAIPYGLTLDGVPAAVSDLVVTPAAGGALSCELDWVNPDLTYAGDPLTELLETRVYRDGELVYTNTNPTIGGVDGYTDALATAGLYNYRVKTYNTVGEGSYTSADVWVGEDIPNAVTDLILTDVNVPELTTQLDWTNPTTGVHGGYFTGVLGYDVERSDGETFMINGSVTTWQDDTIVDPGVYSYMITPFTSVGSGPSTLSPQVGIGVSIVQVGNGEVGDYETPINLYYMDSMVEVVYMQDWINEEMNIYTIAFHANTTSPLASEFDLEIWMGETMENDLSAGWIDGNQLQQTFAGTLDVAPGDSWIDIQLDTAFEYSNTGNLVMLIIRNDSDFYYDTDQWWCSESDTPFRTRLDYDDNADGGFNALTGPWDSTLEKSIYPDVRFYWSLLEHGIVEGVITDAVTTDPIEGAEVMVGTYGPVTSNNNGEYIVEDVVTGIHEVTASKEGYYDFAESTEVLIGETVQLDIMMNPNLIGGLDGYVTNSETGEPIVGVGIHAVSVSGYEFDAVTNSSGYYEILDIIVDTYDVSCLSPDYPTELAEDVIIEEGLTTTVDFTMGGFTYWSDFEANDGGFLSNDSSGWQWGVFTSGPEAGYSGTNGWGTGIDGSYPNDANLTLDSPESYLVGSSTAVLEFWQWYYIEQDYDGGNVKISTDEGSSWEVIEPLTGYTGTGYASGPLAGEGTFSGYINNFWQLVQFDLSDYVGENVMFRWHFGSDSSMGYDGWYFDDVMMILGDGTSSDPIEIVPIHTALKGNYPNPFNPSTTINFSLKNDSKVRLQIYNIRGQLVKTLIDNNMKADYHSVEWNGTDNSSKAVSSGVYFYKMKAGKFSSIKKMMLMK